MERGRKIPTLVELCIQIAIDNLRYITDVGDLDLHLLKDILPHCTVDQLMHIEKSTVGRDLSPVTDSLWKKFFELQFGVESVNLVVKRMKQKQVAFKWRQLYEAKAKEREEAQNKSVEKFKQRYAEDLARKQSRQIQICSKVPPSSSKRSFSGGSGSCSNLSKLKSNLMKKAKIECLNSHEAQIHAVMRKNALQRTFSAQSVPRSTKPILGKSSASNSKLGKSLPRG